MKICLVTTSYPRWEGDHRSLFIYEVAHELQSQGNSVLVVSIHSPGAKRHESLAGVEVHRPMYLPEKLETLQKEDGGITVAWQKHPLTRLAIIPFILAQAIAILRFSKDCDIIHANWSLSAFSTWLSKPFHRKPYVVTVHGSDIFKGSSIPVVSTLTRICLNSAHHIIAVSSALQQALITLGVDLEKITVISNGVNLDTFHPSNDPPGDNILFVGNLAESKGIEYLIKAMPGILQRLPGYRLTIIGDGPKRQDLEHLARSLEIQASIDFLGSLPQPVVGEWMRKSKIFVLPSLNEGFGIVLLEALASGLPVVGTEVGGIKDIILPEVGALVPPANPERLASAILNILADEDRYKSIRSFAVQYVTARYTWKSKVQEIVGIYRQSASE
jgi:glycosyltransferase involved in cell wall biosynthesis